MMNASKQPTRTIDEYIAMFTPEVRAILEKIRSTVAKAAPAAYEAISYQIPVFVLNGPLVYFAAFKRHVGFYPPVTDQRLKHESAVYANEKGNLRFPLNEPMPYALITKLVKARIKENQVKAPRQRVSKRAA
jgi:uncharacterized protein YdhG (YjbR/CyaY superfamily)